MADQTQRLEIATVRAEVGSNIVFRFANDAAAAAPIPTESGDIQNLKQVVLEIQQDAAEKISISTTIYPTVAAGLAATADQGIFLVQSSDADEIYTVWQNQGGTAVNTGKTALSATAIQAALDASSEAARAAEDAADVAVNRTAGFLPPSSTPPSVRDSGLPLQAGDRYFNTEDQTEYIYREGEWTANDSIVAINKLNSSISVISGPGKIPRANPDGKLDPSYIAGVLKSKDIETRLPSPSLLALEIRRALDAKLYDTISVKDFVIIGDAAMSSPETADWYPVYQRTFDWVQKEVVGRIRGISIYMPSNQYNMSQVAKLDLAPVGTKDTGAVGIRLVGDGTAQTSVVAMPSNTTGLFHMTSGRNMEVFEVRGMSFLSNLDEDAATNSGTALLIDSAIKRGDVGYGDQPRWSCVIDDIYIGGYGKTAGNIARRGNWDIGINIDGKYHPKLSNIRCLARYSNIVGARTACRYAIYFSGGCYSPDMTKMYIHGGWERGIWLDDVFNIIGGFEDFRLTDSFIAGADHGFGCAHEFDNRTDTDSLYEPGGYIGGLHINCRKFGVTIRHHRHVIINGLYGYVAREDRAGGEPLPSVILLDGAADIQIGNTQFFEKGFYKSDTNASCAVRIEGASEGITIDAQFGNGGIGVLNNSTYTKRKTINIYAKLLTSRRLDTGWAPLKLLVDNAGTATVTSDILQNSQDVREFASGKPNSSTYPAALRARALAPGNPFGGALELSSSDLTGALKHLAILRSRTVLDTNGVEIGSALGVFVQKSGSLAEAFRLQPPTVNNDSYAYILFTDESGNPVSQRVKRGAANSGGTNRRALVVDN